MSKTIPIWCAAVTFALSAGLSAQSSPTTPRVPAGSAPQIPTGAPMPESGHAVPQPTTVPPPAAAAKVTVAATGCVERWRSTPTASPSGAVPDKGPAGVLYVLTHVQGETQSTSGKTDTTSPQTRYLLLPDPKVDFAAHLNHRVKIAGTIAPQPSAGASVVDSIADPATRETNLPADEKSEQYQDNLIEVSALTMVARACSTQ